MTKTLPDPGPPTETLSKLTPDNVDLKPTQQLGPKAPRDMKEAALDPAQSLTVPSTAPPQTEKTTPKFPVEARFDPTPPMVAPQAAHKTTSQPTPATPTKRKIQPISTVGAAPKGWLDATHARIFAALGRFC